MNIEQGQGLVERILEFINEIGVDSQCEDKENKNHPPVRIHPLHKSSSLPAVKEQNSFWPKAGKKDMDSDHNGREKWKEPDQSHGGSADGELLEVASSKFGHFHDYPTHSPQFSCRVFQHFGKSA